MTGSIKDRVALYFLQQLYAQGKLQGDELINAGCCGNTGISFAALRKAIGHRVLQLDTKIY